MAKRRGIPGYLKHSSGQARVLINGRSYYLGKYGSKASRQRYDALIAEWLTSGRSQTFGLDAGNLTLADVMVGYLKHCKVHYSAGVEYKHVKSVLRVVNQLYATVLACEFGPQQFKAVRQKLIDDPKCQWAKRDLRKTAKPLSRTYINSQMKRLTRMFRWSAANGDVPPDLYQTLRLIPSLQRGRTEAREAKSVGPVSIETVRATLPFLPSVVADMVRLHYLVAARPAEICGLTPEMIDRTGEVWIARLKNHKTARHGRVRELHFGPAAQQILRPYLAREPNAKLFSPVESEANRRAELSKGRKTPANCGNRPGYSERARAGRPAKRPPATEYNPGSYARAVLRAAKKAGVEHWTPNQLRHAGGTLIRSQYGLEHSQAILGHSKADMTEHYAKVDQERATEVAKNDSERRID